MDYDSYRIVYIVGLGLCIFFIVLAIILFFALKIPKVIGDLSGATARKAINTIREQNENSADNEYKSSKINKERGRLTDKISQSGRLLPNDRTMGLGIKTEKISTQQLSNDGSDETMVLNIPSSGNETTVLNAAPVGNETTVLNAHSAGNETAILSQVRATVSEPEITHTVFEILYEITYIHTTEIIV